MPPATVSASVWRSQRRRFAVPAAIASAAGAGAFFAMQPAGGLGHVVFFLTAAIIGLAAWAIGGAYRQRRSLGIQDLALTAAGLGIGEVLRPADVRSAGVLLQESGVVVRVEASAGRTFDIAVSENDSGWDLLELAGLGLGARPVVTESAPLRDRVALVGVGVALCAGEFVAAYANVPFVATAVLALTTALALAIPVAAMVARRRVTVGLDGVRVRGAAGSRFIPLDEIASVRLGVPSSVVVVKLRSSNVVRIAMDNPRYTDDGADAAAIVEESLLEALAWRDANEAGAPAALLREGANGDVAAWVSRLRTGLTAERDYRSAGASVAQMWSAFEDVRNDVRTRAAAAVALGGAGEDARARLRVEAAATTLPRLRVAIEAAARDDDDAIIEALAALTEERR